MIKQTLHKLSSHSFWNRQIVHLFPKHGCENAESRLSTGFLFFGIILC